MGEQETVDYLTVRVASYGHPDRVQRGHVQRLVRELTVSYGPVMVQDQGGRWWRWDQSARDPESGSRGCIVECYPPDLRLGQKPFKPKLLKNGGKSRPVAVSAPVVSLPARPELPFDDA